MNRSNAAPGSSSAAAPDPNWQPKTVDEFLARGYARLRINKYPQAEADAEDALKLRPDALAARELDPDLAPAYNALGSAYSELGQLELAKTNLDRAIELDPNFILARENRAKLLGRQQDFRAEQDELTVILGLSPNNQWAKDTREAILEKQP